MAAIASGLIACSNPPGPTAADLNVSYETALAETADAADFAPGEDAAALERLEAYFADMTPASVAETRSIYADRAVLYDNLAVVTGAKNIEAYFAKAAGEVDGLQVQFEQVSRTGIDYYIRWKMIITSEGLSPGEPLISYGVTHFRFDDDGRVLLHRDFWDAATGLYEYLPWIGDMITRLRVMLGEQPRDEG